MLKKPQAVNEFKKWFLHEGSDRSSSTELLWALGENKNRFWIRKLQPVRGGLSQALLQGSVGDRAQPGPHPRKKNGILVLLKQSRSWGKPRGWILQGVPEEAKPSLELLEVLQAPSSEWALLSFPFWKKWDRNYCKHWGIPNPTGSLNCHTGVTNIETSQIPQDLLDCYTRDKHWDIPNRIPGTVTHGWQALGYPKSLETLNCHRWVTNMGHPKPHRIPGNPELSHKGNKNGTGTSQIPQDPWNCHTWVMKMAHPKSLETLNCHTWVTNKSHRVINHILIGWTNLVSGAVPSLGMDDLRFLPTQIIPWAAKISLLQPFLPPEVLLCFWRNWIPFYGVLPHFLIKNKHSWLSPGAFETDVTPNRDLNSSTFPTPFQMKGSREEKCQERNLGNAQILTHRRQGSEILRQIGKKINPTESRLQKWSP